MEHEKPHTDSAEGRIQINHKFVCVVVKITGGSGKEFLVLQSAPGQPQVFTVNDTCTLSLKNLEITDSDKGRGPSRGRQVVVWCVIPHRIEGSQRPSWRAHRGRLVPLQNVRETDDDASPPSDPLAEEMRELREQAVMDDEI